jgi:hypothetical protein
LQGFRLVENLEEYTGLKVLYLEGNGLVEISGLDAQTEMRSLYLHENCIETIQGIEHMVGGLLYIRSASTESDPFSRRASW